MKKTNERTFQASINGENYEIKAYCYSKGYMNYETVRCDRLGLRGSYSYMNRPWQAFTYDNALTDLIGKAGKRFGDYVADSLRDQVWAVEDRRVRSAADEMFGRFEKAWNEASPETRESVSRSGLTVESFEEADAVTAGLEFLNAIGK